MMTTIQISLVNPLIQLVAHLLLCVEVVTLLKAQYFNAPISTISLTTKNIAATKCLQPVVPKQTHELLSPNSYTYHEEILYECNSGYEYAIEFGTVNVFSTICQANGSWIPDHSTTVCTSTLTNTATEIFVGTMQLLIIIQGNGVPFMKHLLAMQNSIGLLKIHMVSMRR